MVDLFRNRKWDLVSHRWTYYIISLILLVIGLVALFMHGLNQGIEFKGGGLITYRIDGRIPANQTGDVIHDLRDGLGALDEAQIKERMDAIVAEAREKNPTAPEVTELEKQVPLQTAEMERTLNSTEVQISPSAVDGTGDLVLVRTLMPTAESKDIDRDGFFNNQVEVVTQELEQVLSKYNIKLAAGQAEHPEGQDQVEATVSNDLKTTGIVATLLGTFLILIWIWIRYNIGGFGFRYSAAGILALLHDLATLVGLMALFRVQVNSPFIAALLTVLGFSIHDTIVIFDRIRENIRLRKGRTFAETVNISLLETLARSVNTVLTVLLTLLALFFFGGPTLRDFVVAMLIGVLVGCYSSIFVASQLLVSWSTPKDKVMPKGDFLPEIPAAKPALPAAPQPIAAAVSAAPAETAAAPTATVQAQAASRDAIQRARQAGKTSKRKR